MKLILDRPLLDKRRTFCNSGILDKTDEVEDDRRTRAQLKTPPSHDAYPRGGARKVTRYRPMMWAETGSH